MLARRVLEISTGRVRYDTRDMFDSGLGTRVSSPRGRAFYHQAETEIYCVYGDYDAAIRALARAVDIGFYDRLWLDACPLLTPLRVDLRYHALRRIVIERTTMIQQALHEDV